MGKLFKDLKQKKLKAQSIIEFGLAFIFVVFIFFAVAEYSFYWQTVNSVQTFADDLNANLMLVDGNRICNVNNPRVLALAQGKARRYIENSISLSFGSTNHHSVELISAKSYYGRPVFKIKITCDAETSNSTTTQAIYLYHGLFLFKAGHEILSLSSVHSPKF